MGNKISVVVVTYKRLETLERILKTWMEQTDDVWLADSSNKFETNLPIRHVRFNPDPGNRTRHAVALLTDGDYVIKTDDDLVPLLGFANELAEQCGKLNGIVGIHGRIFWNENYHGGTRCFSGKTVSKPTKVDFVGITTCTQRKWLTFDLKGCDSPIEDVFWQMGAYPNVDKYVIPTKNYEQLPVSESSDCLFYNPSARKQRTEYCREWYRRTHK